MFSHSFSGRFVIRHDVAVCVRLTFSDTGDEKLITVEPHVIPNRGPYIYSQPKRYSSLTYLLWCSFVWPSPSSRQHVTNDKNDRKHCHNCSVACAV